MKRPLISILQAVLIFALAGLAWAQDGVATPETTVEGTPATAPEAVATPAAHKHRKKKTQASVSPTPSTTEQLSVSPTGTPAAESKADYQFNALVVTGTKTKLKVLDSPAEVEVIDQKSIENKAIGYIDDALTTVPGVEVSRLYEGGQAVTVIQRGIPGYDNNLVLIDGFVLNQPFNDRVFWNRVPTPLVDHVEVVEGPFSSLYGRSAVGGVINIITKEPVGERFDFDENWNTYGQRTTDIDYQKRLDKHFALFLGIENTAVNGYEDNQFIQASAVTNLTAGQIAALPVVTGFKQTTTTTGSTIYNIGQVAPSVLDNNNISGKFYWNPDEDNTLSLLVNVSFWDQPTDNVQGEQGTNWLQGPNPTFFNPSSSGNGYNWATGQNVQLGSTGQAVKVSENLFYTEPGQNSFGGAYLQWKSHLGTDTDFQANVAYTDGPHLANEGGAGQGSTTPPTGSTLLGGPVTGSVNPWFGDQEEYADFQLHWKWGNHTLVGGISGDNATTGQDIALYPNWTNIYNYSTYSSSNTGLDDLLFGAYLQDQWKFLPNLTATLGARVDYWDPFNIQIFTGNSSNNYVGSEVGYSQNTFVSFNPKASLVWAFDPNGSLRASIGTAFNPPTPSDLTGSSATTGSSGSVTYSAPNPGLVPAQDLGSEVGGEYQFPTGTTLSATFFDNLFTNIVYQNIYADPVTAGQTDEQYQNAASADIQGFDAEVRQKVASNLSAYANTTIISAHFLPGSFAQIGSGKTATEISISGYQLPFVSPVIVNGGADWNIDRWTISGWVTYHASEFQTANNSDTTQGVQGSIDPFTTVNLKFGYRVGDLTLTGGVDNLFNVQYYDYFQNPGIVFNFGGRLFLL